MKKLLLIITLLVLLVGSAFAEKYPVKNMGIIISEGYTFHICMEEDVSEAEIIQNKAFARKAVSIACENDKWNEFKAECVRNWILENPDAVIENQGTKAEWIAVFVTDYAQKHNVNILLIPVTDMEE